METPSFKEPIEITSIIVKMKQRWQIPMVRSIGTLIDSLIDFRSLRDQKLVCKTGDKNWWQKLMAI
jgi:hypothetical protein